MTQSTATPPSPVSPTPAPGSVTLPVDPKQKHDPLGPAMKRTLEDVPGKAAFLGLKIKVRPSGPEQVGCPGCGCFRPEFCIALTKKGWRCDGCITDHRRHGRAHEIEAIVGAAADILKETAV